MAEADKIYVIIGGHDFLTPVIVSKYNKATYLITKHPQMDLADIVLNFVCAHCACRLKYLHALSQY